MNVTVRPCYHVLFLCGVLATVMAFSPGVSAGDHGSPGAPAKKGMMGTLEFPSTELSALPQWMRILSRMAEEKKKIAQCDADVDACLSPKAVAWRAKIQALKSRDRLVQLLEINRFINTWPKKTDGAVFAAVDHWASPLEFLDRSGDSEDFAIAKFFSLRELGFKNKHLRIVIATDILSNRVHAFTSAYHDGKIYVLDNLSDTVLTQDHSKYYVPSYSVNETTRWAHIPVHDRDGLKTVTAN